MPAALASSLTVAALLAAPVPSLRVEGSSECPRPAEVMAKLSGLVRATDLEVHVAVLLRNGPVLRVLLSDADGTLLAQREVTDASPCADLASVAAVIIAAWEAELRGTSPDLPPAPPLAPLPRLADWDVGAAGLASWSGAGQWAPGALAFASVGSEGGWVRAELAVAGTSSRPVSVGRGEARWFRVGGGLGARLRLAQDPIGVDLHAEAWVGVLSVRGAGFDEDLGSVDVDPGVLAGARVWYRLGPVRPWVGVGGWAWLRRQEVRVEQAGAPLATGALPRFELVLTAGLSLERERR